MAKERIAQKERTAYDALTLRSTALSMFGGARLMYADSVRGWASSASDFGPNRMVFARHQFEGLAWVKTDISAI